MKIVLFIWIGFACVMALMFFSAEYENIENDMEHDKNLEETEKLLEKFSKN